MNDARGAIEALRAGVPNRAAIRSLGTGEAGIREQFLLNLQDCERKSRSDDQPILQIIAGGFGAGKSHLLGYLQELALSENFIVSWVVISKETPLFDLAKLYISAMRNATVPKRNDDAMTAVLARLRPKGDAYDDLEQWAASPEADLSPLFPALLHLLPRASPEHAHQIARFLAGGRLSVVVVKQWLREVGAAKLFQLKPVKQAELARQRLRFVSRLIFAAGYGGWVLLLDEVELIGRYSVLQRGRSYAELARWIGLDEEEKVPGVVTVAAITEDFPDEVIGKRRDDEQVPLKLTNRNERKVAERARLGMDALEKKRELLKAPSAEFLHSSLDKVRYLYFEAYRWNAGAVEIGEPATAKSMRQYIKSWITAWDLERLFGTKPEIETVEVPSDYEENKDIEQSAESNGDDPQDA